MNFKIFNRQNLDISEIIEGCRHNKERHQEMLYKMYAPKVLTLCRRYESRDFDAHDILQDTFMAVFDHIRQFDSTKASIETWIKRIAVNTALKKIRNKKQYFIEIDSLGFDIKEDTDEVEDEAIVNLTEEHIIAEIQKLPYGYKTVFNMFVIDGFSHKEIADTLGIKETTSKSQLFKAKKMLREQLLPQTKNMNVVVTV